MASPILIVDDEEHIRELVAHYLRREGFAVEHAATGPEALEAFARVQPALIVLDVMLPGLSGTDVCREIRKTSDVPILMLTAKDDIIDKVVGFELGADDYLTKPFEPKELVVRVKALQRRVQANAERPSPTLVLTVGELRIDPDRRDVRIGAKVVGLRPKEFDLLLALARHPGQVFSREQLLNTVWGYDFEGFSRTVDVHVQHLRDKLGAAGGGTGWIHTVWGVGYKFEAADTG
ncbi:MAG TPA: response regulator transcription factor [Chloroflexota bacterium]|nr:response regulator transcription factor [Chloroflexota bacterium]